MCEETSINSTMIETPTAGDDIYCDNSIVGKVRQTLASNAPSGCFHVINEQGQTEIVYMKRKLA